MFLRPLRTDKDDRFQLYLDKTFNKTASLMANSCKSVAILANENNSDKNIVVSKTDTPVKVVVRLIQKYFRTWRTNTAKILELLFNSSMIG